MLDTALKNKWIEALRSGEYQQIRQFAYCRVINADETEDKKRYGFCAHGILGYLLGARYQERGQFFDHPQTCIIGDLFYERGMTKEQYDRVNQWNEVDKLSFIEIADKIKTEF